MEKIRVAVIGCGAAGLCALRHLISRPEQFEATGFEQLKDVGGTWRYTESTGKDKNGVLVQSSMYKNLRTNLPKEAMAFPDFTFPNNMPSFIKHDEVLKYLTDYCQHFDLPKYIKYETTVDHVLPVLDGAKMKWKVSYTTAGNKQENMMFDAIVVCNGHYSVPLVPKMDGDEVFTGTIIHSHDYRDPKMFKDKTVVCLGAAASGQDISLDIATEAKKVILSSRKKFLETPLPGNVFQQTGIDKLGSNTVTFTNGDIEDVDAILLCTGYRYDFPFLDPKCELDITDERVTPLFKHIVHAKYPSLCFVGITKLICPFPQFENQVKFILSVLDGTQELPSEAEMLADIEADYQERLANGMPHRKAHTMGPLQWAYNDELAEMGKFEPIPVVVQNLFDEVHRTRIKDLPNYKKKKYTLVGKAFEISLA